MTTGADIFCFTKFFRKNGLFSLESLKVNGPSPPLTLPAAMVICPLPSSQLIGLVLLATTVKVPVGDPNGVAGGVTRISLFIDSHVPSLRDTIYSLPPAGTVCVKVNWYTLVVPSIGAGIGPVAKAGCLGAPLVSFS